MKIAPYAKITGQTTAGATVASVLTWAWNIKNPDMLMTPEVAAASGALLGPVMKYIVSWLPDPNGG